MSGLSRRRGYDPDVPFSPTMFAFFAILAFLFLAWEAGKYLFVPKEVRQLERMKRALKAQVKSKKEVLKLRTELNKLQAQLDRQQDEEMKQLETQISQLGIDDQVERARAGRQMGPSSDDGETSTPPTSETE